MLPRLRLPLLPEALALLAAIFLLPGLAGHDPWKPQDILTLAIAHGMASGGDLLVPRVAGLRWLVDPPLYHWVAAALGSLLGWLLEFHAAARLASGAFVAAALYFVYTAGRGGSEAGRAPVTAAAAALLLLGSLGLMVHAHEALPELASLAAISGALACLPHVLRRPLQAGAGAGVALVLIAAAFILPGLTGNDPWKTHDAVGLGIVHGMSVTGELLVPRIAGTPWLFDPPLYHWIAVAFGAALRSLLEFHAAARLASGVLVAAAFYFTWRTARDWEPEGEKRPSTAAAAMLLVLGAVGLMVHAHEALPELAGLAALCGALAALPHAPRRPLLAGFAFGAALGVAALASGWIAPLALAIAVIAGRFACPAWRVACGSAASAPASAARPASSGSASCACTIRPTAPSTSSIAAAAVEGRRSTSGSQSRAARQTK